MLPGDNVKRNLLRFYLDPELLTEEEAEDLLRDQGINAAGINEKGNEFIKKLEAGLKLDDGKHGKEKISGLQDEGLIE